MQTPESPTVSINVIHEIAYLPKRYHAPFLELILRLRTMDPAARERVLAVLTSRSIHRSDGPENIKRVVELLGRDELNTDDLERYAANPPSAGGFLVDQLLRLHADVRKSQNGETAVARA